MVHVSTTPHEMRMLQYFRVVRGWGVRGLELLTFETRGVHTAGLEGDFDRILHARQRLRGKLMNETSLHQKSIKTYSPETNRNVLRNLSCGSADATRTICNQRAAHMKCLRAGTHLVTERDTPARNRACSAVERTRHSSDSLGQIPALTIR